MQPSYLLTLGRGGILLAAAQAWHGQASTVTGCERASTNRIGHPCCISTSEYNSAICPSRRGAKVFSIERRTDERRGHTGSGVVRLQRTRVRVPVRHNRLHQYRRCTDRRAFLLGGHTSHGAACPSDDWQPGIEGTVHQGRADDRGRTWSSSRTEGCFAAR